MVHQNKKIMRNILVVIYLGLCLYGCKSYVQVYNTNSSITMDREGFYIYENDSIKLTYSFWAEKGLMTFSILNKLKEPLYVDWKKSSYIDNSVKLNYWIDEEKSKAISTYSNHYYRGPNLIPGYATSISVGTSIISKVKEERVTFIPPSSHYYRSQFYIAPQIIFGLNKNSNFEDVPRNDKPEKTTRIYKAIFNIDNSPLVFRNFLTLSTTDDFKTEFYVDNEFYVNEILEMEERHFIRHIPVTSNNKNADPIYEEVQKVVISNFEKPSSFFLRIPNSSIIDD